jgi:hypothetical protein
MRFGPSEFRRRLWLSVATTAALLLVALTIAVRMHKTPDRVATRAEIRAKQFARLQFVAGRLTQYARDYHRPAYRFDSVAVHLDSAHAAEFRRYLTDLWGDSIEYYWNFSGFKLSSNAGLTSLGRLAAFDSAERQARLVNTVSHSSDADSGARLARLIFEVDTKVYITAAYGWPEAAERDSMQLKRWPSVDSGQSTHD